MASRLAPANGRLARSLGRCIVDNNALSLRRVRPTRITSTTTSVSTTTSTSTTRTSSLHTSPSLAAAVAAPVSSTQPPSAKQPDIRKSQLLRTYTSLLRSSPLLLVFQHSNLTGPEWTAVRRELSVALRLVDEAEAAKGTSWPEDFYSSIRMQVIRARMFGVALRITEFFDPAKDSVQNNTFKHDLSKTAYAFTKDVVAKGGPTVEQSVYSHLQPLLVGPLAVLSFPAVSPAHLSAALSVLAPTTGATSAFPPPGRKKNPGYYEPVVQGALPKLMLVGGRVEGQAFDIDGVQWVGSIQGGRAGLQAQLVAMLQSAGMGLTAALEGASKNLWLTMESRRSVLEEESGEKKA